MKNSKQKLFVVKKYIMANSAHDALRKERRHRPDDVWVDEDWKKEHKEQLTSCIGFSVEKEYYED